MQLDYTQAYESEARMSDSEKSGPKCGDCGKIMFLRIDGVLRALPPEKGGCECPRHPKRHESRSVGKRMDQRHAEALEGILAVLAAIAKKQGIEVELPASPAVAPAAAEGQAAPTGVAAIDTLRAQHEAIKKAKAS